MIKGMPTLIEFKSLKENVNFAKKNNLDFIELNMNLPYCFNIKKGELTKYNFLFTMHISEELNIYELNENLRKSYLKEIKRQINKGIENGIKKYTIHLNQGIYFTLPNSKIYLNGIFNKEFNKSLDKSLNELNKIAIENDIYINFENTKINDIIKHAIDKICTYNNFGFTLDIGHNEKNGNKFYEYLKDKSKIRHIHMHDYDGKSDHLEIGSGNIDFNKYKNEINNNYVVIEIKEASQLINSIKKF